MYESLSNETEINADIALKNRLYVSGWCLSGSLRDARENPNNKLVLLHYDDDGIPVAVLYASHDCSDITLQNYTNVQVFVRKSKRNKGIGKKLVNKLKELSPNANFIWSCGIKGSRMFWIKQFKEND